jgi:hypothetical protein
VVGAGALAVLGPTLVLVGAVSWMARIGGWRSPVWVLAAWVLALLVLAVGGVLAWRAFGALSTARLARRLETDGAWRAGALSALLQVQAEGTSGDLLNAADGAQARDIGARGDAAVSETGTDGPARPWTRAQPRRVCPRNPPTPGALVPSRAPPKKKLGGARRAFTARDLGLRGLELEPVPVFCRP